MSRTTTENVRALLATSLDDSAVESWIEIAASVVDNYSTRCTSASASLLEKLETLIACHLIVSIVDRSKTVTSKTVGTSSETYMTVTGSGLAASPYGQQALMLDPCGVLGQLQSPGACGGVL